MRNDDPLKADFEEYARELRERIANATVIPVDEWESAMAQVEERARMDDIAVNRIENARHEKNADTLLALDVQQLLDNGQLLVVDPTTNTAMTGASEVVAALK